MRDGGKGDTPRPLGIPMEEFDKNFEVVFGKRNKLEPIPFAGMVDTGEEEDDDSERRS
jgi:hypothetical protein